MVRIAPESARATNIQIIDIERLPGLAEVWDQKTRFIPVSKFKRLPATICFAAKRYGRPQREARFEATWLTSFEEMIAASWEVYDQADIVVTYNGKRFDTPNLRTDWHRLGLGEPSPFKEVDLYQVNRAAFGRVSFSLQHLLEQLGHHGKLGHYNAAEAQRAMDGSELDQRRLRRYNVGDVTGTEWAYDRLRGSMPGHPHMGVAEGLSCNQCGSTRLAEAGEHTAAVLVYPAYRCDRCGARIKDRKACGRVAWTAGIR